MQRTSLFPGNVLMDIKKQDLLQRVSAGVCVCICVLLATEASWRLINTVASNLLQPVKYLDVQQRCGALRSAVCIAMFQWSDRKMRVQN